MTDRRAGNTRSRVGIVGGGQAAARTALALRTGGFAGGITIFSTEAHLPYERPPLSKAALLDCRMPAPFIATEAEYRRLDIEVRLGTPIDAIGREPNLTLTSDGAQTEYDWLVIATGSRPREIAIKGADASRINYLRTLDDSRAIERRVRPGARIALIGAGFIGLEAAAALKARDCSVTVIEQAPMLLPRLRCPQMSAAVLAHHRARGIVIHLGVGVTRAVADNLVLANGTVVEADFIIVGIGIVPETTLASQAGLDVDDGIVVDEHCRTVDRRIFAAGDCARGFHPLVGLPVRLESWQNANVQAQIVASSILGLATPASETPWAWSDQGDLRLEVAGVAADVDRIFLRRESDAPDALTALQVRKGRLVAGCTLNNSRDMAVIRRLLAGGGELALHADQLAEADQPLRRFLPKRARHDG